MADISTDTAIATGASTARSMANRFADTVNVKDFGAVGNGIAADHVAIQAAINYAQSQGGGEVFFPRGLYRITSGLTVTAANVILTGSSCGGSRILISKVSSNAVTWTLGTTDFVGARDLGFFQDAGFPPTSGFVFEFGTAGIQMGTFDRIVFVGVYGCVKSTVTGTGANTTINNLWFRDCWGQDLKQYGVWLQNTVNWTFENCTFGMTPAAGRIPLVVDSNNDGGTHGNCNYLSGSPGVLFQNTQGGMSVPSQQMSFRETAADNCIGFAWQINALKRTQFVDCWAAAAAEPAGANVALGLAGTAAAVEGNSFTACIFIADADAVQISGGVDNTQFTGCKFPCYGRFLPANTWSGINIWAHPTTSFIITGCMFWHDTQFTGNEWHGIRIQSGSYRSYVVSNNLATKVPDPGGFLSGSVLADGGTTTKKYVLGNVGP